MAFTEKLEQVGSHPFNNGEVGDQQGEPPQEELPQTKRGRKKRLNKNSTRPVNFVLSLDLIERLGYYRVWRTRVEGHTVTNSEVAERALDEFLTREGYPPPPPSSD